MAAEIQHPAGKNTTNEATDVMIVQALLNKFIIAGCMQPFPPLGIDGVCGKNWPACW